MLHGKHGTATSSPDDYHLPGLGIYLRRGQSGVSEIPPMLFTALRYILLSAILLPSCALSKAICRGDFHLIGYGVGAFCAVLCGMSLADNVSAVAVARNWACRLPPLCRLFFERTGRLARWTGIALAFGGVMIISFDPAIIDERIGLALVVGAAFIGSLGTIVMKRISDTGVYQMQAWIAMLSWPPLIAVSLIFEATMWPC